MRRLALALAVVAVTACARRHYQFTSDRGRQCFNACQRGRYQCNATCYQNRWCLSSCDRDEANCMGSCPDLERVQ